MRDAIVARVEATWAHRVVTDLICEGVKAGRMCEATALVTTIASSAFLSLRAKRLLADCAKIGLGA